MAVQPGQVFDREGAPVGDQQGSGPQEPCRHQPVRLLVDGRMAVGVAVQALAQDRDGTEFVYHRSDADLDELGVIPIAVRDVSRRHVRRGGWWPRQFRWPWLGRLVSPVEDEVGGVEVKAIAGQVGAVEGLGSDRGDDGVALAEEGVEGPAQAVIIQTLRREVPEEVGSGVGGPGGDVDQGGGLAEAGREQETEDLAVREGQLGVGG